MPMAESVAFAASFGEGKKQKMKNEKNANFKNLNWKKIGFKSPTESWFRENIDELENIFLDNPDFLNLFNSNKVRELLNRHKEGENLEKQLFLLLSLNYLYN